MARRRERSCSYLGYHGHFYAGLTLGTEDRDWARASQAAIFCPRVAQVFHGISAPGWSRFDLGIGGAHSTPSTMLTAGPFDHARGRPFDFLSTVGRSGQAFFERGCNGRTSD